VKRNALAELEWKKGDVVVTRNGKGPGKVTYQGHYAGRVQVGRANSLTFYAVKWATRWASARLLRERALALYHQLMHRHKVGPKPSGKINWRRMRNRSARVRALAAYG
jgi:hypothetical protein